MYTNPLKSVINFLIYQLKFPKTLKTTTKMNWGLLLFLNLKPLYIKECDLSPLVGV